MGDTYSGRKAAAAGACHCAENREWSMVRNYHRSAAENVGIGADAGDAAVTGSAFHAVAPVSALCAAFAAQPSTYPPEAPKPDVAPTCGGVAETANEEGRHLWAAFGGERSRKRRGRTKPRCRARPAAVTTARGAGSLGILRRGCCEGKNSPVGVRSAKSPAVSGKTAGLRTKIGGILVWQATRSSFHSG